MSRLYVRVMTGFYTHRKTLRLKSRLGNDALWLPPRLWAYAAENQPDGDFSKYEVDEIALLIGYGGDAQTMIAALTECGFLDADRKVHGWDEHNGYHQTFADRARVAAEARWSKEREKKEKKTRQGDKQCSNNAQAMLEASPLRLRVNKWFGRRDTTPWSEKEIKALAIIESSAPPGDDVGLLERYYSAVLPPDKDIRRRDLGTMLNNWAGELDRARRWQSQAGLSTTGKKSLIEQELDAMDRQIERLRQ